MHISFCSINFCRRCLTNFSQTSPHHIALSTVKV